MARSRSPRRTRLPEPHAHEDPLTHPLWQTLSHNCLFVPSQAHDAFLLSGYDVDCRHSSMIIISDVGRIFYQCRREGRQLFGGGNCRMPLLLRLHSCRREQWMESNFDVASNPAVISLSNPILVIQDTYYGGCLVQICIIDDSQIRIDDDGTVYIGDTQMWSREVARDVGKRRNKYHELELEPTTDHISAGTFFQGKPIMGIGDLLQMWDDPSQWRCCDWITCAMLREHLQTILRNPSLNKSSPAFCKIFGGVKHREFCEYIMGYWSHMGNVAQNRWPLLTTAALYTCWRDAEWRHQQCLTRQDWYYA